MASSTTAVGTSPTLASNTTVVDDDYSDPVGDVVEKIFIGVSVVVFVLVFGVIGRCLIKATRPLLSLHNCCQDLDPDDSSD